MKPFRAVLAGFLGIVIVFAGVSAAFAQQRPTQVESPTPEEEAMMDFLGGVFGWTHNGSATVAEFAGYWTHCFKDVVLATKPKPSHDRSFSFNASPASRAPALQVVPAVVGEFGVLFSNSTVTFMGGPRVIVVPSNRRVAVYGEFLFGALHFSGDVGGTDKLMMPAAGVIVAIPNSRLKVTGEIGWPIDFFDGFHETDTRIVFGVVWSMNRR